MKIGKFITIIGLFSLVAGCLAGGALVWMVAPHLLHHSISLASRTIGVNADGSISPLSARLVENPVLLIIYYFLRFFLRPT